MKLTEMAKTELPPGVKVSDTKWPESYKDLDREKGEYGQLTLYNTSRFGWCISTLRIGNRNGRTYGISLDGQIVSMGTNNASSVVTVYLRKSEAKRLQKYADLYKDGMEQASGVRDRISTRRAKGQVMRSQGRTSWRWDE